MNLKPLAAAAAALALCLPAAAQNLKPGLWEVQNKMGGNPELEEAMAEMHKQMASMSPAERKQMEAAMGKQGVQMGAGTGGAMAMKTCMTKEMIERNDMATSQGSDCKITSQSKSGNTLKMAYACTNPKTTGESQITYHSPEAYSMKMASSSTVNGKTEKMTMDASGKWLGADCGAIKPVTAAVKK